MGMDAGAVNQIGRFKDAGGRMHGIMGRHSLNALHLAVQAEFYAVAHGGLCQRNAQPPRVDNPAGRGVQRAAYRLRHRWLHGADFSGGQNPQPLYAVCHAVLI